MSLEIADWYTKIEKPVAEKTTRRWTGIIKDDTGAAVPATSIFTLTLTLYPKATPAARINNRDQQDVLNANNGTVDSNGNWVFGLTIADNIIVDSNLTEEQHMALFEYAWAGGVKAGKHLIEFTVTNLPTVS
jgi:hypothetical protein